MNSIASSQKRIVAFVIDDIIVSFLFVAIFFDQMASLFSPEFINENLLVNSPEMTQHIVNGVTLFLKENFLVFMLIKIIYHTFLVWHNGMTFGKYLLKIKTIDEQSGETPDFLRSLLRATVRIFSEFILYVGFLLAFVNPKVQTLHDKVSGVIVVDA
jgi:uncharacterized RDD family membrane protein YckC